MSFIKTDLTLNEWGGLYKTWECQVCGASGVDAPDNNCSIHCGHVYLISSGDGSRTLVHASCFPELAGDDDEVELVYQDGTSRLVTAAYFKSLSPQRVD